MHIENLYSKGRVISFEIFPPKTETGMKNLWRELEKLSIYNPGFISVTYGAGGSTRDKTLDIAAHIKNELNVTPLVHFTCVGLNRSEIESYLKKINELGILNILALRGDPPRGDEKFTPPVDGFSYANELIKYIKSISNFTIVVAGYPEGHVEAPDLNSDINNLIKKIDAGGQIIITQLFFDNNKFYDYMNKIIQKNIKVPVVPGIMPITNKKQLEKITTFFGASIPTLLYQHLMDASTDDEIIKIGIDHATKQCSDLLKWGAPGIHFYPLNKSYASLQVLSNLQIEED